MPRHVAFLRGVSPSNAKMPELKRSFELAGFRNVKTVLSSGNVVFDAASASEAMLEKKAQAAMQAELGRDFYTIVRAVDDLQKLLSADVYARFAVAPNAKRVVSFMRTAPSPAPKLPVEADEARVLCLVGREVYTAYVASALGPVFMKLLQQSFGKDITTRTWDTVRKCAAA
jgi:uncharacterized protein (DUF1697 family)